MNCHFFRIVCIDENDPLEYKILEDANKNTLKEVHAFIDERIEQHPNARWLLLPAYIQ